MWPLQQRRKLLQRGDHSFWRNGKRIAFRRCGLVSPETFDARQSQVSRCLPPANKGCGAKDSGGSISNFSTSEAHPNQAGRGPCGLYATISPMNPEDRERMFELCWRIDRETDSKKLALLIADLNQVIQRKINELRKQPKSER